MGELLGDAAAPGDAGDVDLGISERGDKTLAEARDARRTVGQFRQRRAADSRHVEDDRRGLGQRFEERLRELPVGPDAIEEEKGRARFPAGLHGDQKLLTVDRHHLRFDAGGLLCSFVRRGARAIAQRRSSRGPA